jgi:tetratricopeptide (TPR) repeat protein
MNALQLMGMIYEKSLNRCPDGTEVYRILLQDYEADVDAGKYQMAIADCYFKLREYPQAIDEYAVIVERYSQSTQVPRARFQMANSYALVDNCEAAIAIYEDLLQMPQSLSPQFSADIKLELAFCYGQQEEYGKAVSLYEELEELEHSGVALDANLITRKKERTLQRIAELNRKPQKVDWNRK